MWLGGGGGGGVRILVTSTPNRLSHYPGILTGQSLFGHCLGINYQHYCWRKILFGQMVTSNLLT